MKIVIVSSLLPYPNHSFQSANVIIFELVRAFAHEKGMRTGFLPVFQHGTRDPSSEEREGLERLQEEGVDILPLLVLPPNLPSRPLLRRLITPDARDFYPETSHRHIVEQEIFSYAPDLLFVPISEWLTALCADIGLPKFTLYGNPDPKSSRAMARFHFRHGTISPVAYWARQLTNALLEHAHLKVIMKYNFLGNLALNDAEYYQYHGHPNAFYMQNIWIDRMGLAWKNRRRVHVEGEPWIIAGNIGQLAGTANTHGLEILGRDVLPALRRRMNGRPFEINIFGSKTPHPAVAKLLQAPEIRLRGFVDNIDAELLASDIFLCVNNAGAYKVNHTRYLHAWTLGCCVVAHQDARLSLPEITHRQNALLGGSADEIASLIVEAIENPKLRGQLGENGYRTYRQHFTAEKVVSRIVEQIRQYVP